MEIENRTPHAIALEGADGVVHLIEPTLPPARVVGVQGAQESAVNGIPIHPASYDRVSGLPTFRDGVIIIVSQITALMVAASDPSRTDVVYPATTKRDGATRDKLGVVTVRRLIRPNF